MGAERGVGLRRRAARLLLLLCCALPVAACDAGDPTPAPEPAGPQTAAGPVELTFGVWGAEDELVAYEAMVSSYSAASEGSEVTVRSWPSHAGLVEALREGEVPDVFLVSHDDLAWLQEQELTQPVDELLDERGVDFGDGYSRDALQAFSGDDRLQCMPYGVSPTVMFYNRELVDFDRMRARGLPAPEDEDDRRWNLEEFAAAAAFATRPARGTRGVHVDATLPGLAPFIYSGGGQLFDDEETPRSLAFSDEDTRAALEQALVVLRDPLVTLSEGQLRRADPLEWFERGRLGMIDGHWSLVPRLRQVQGLEFDLMPMPSLDGAATVGGLTGLCLSAGTASTAEAADFVVHALSTESVSRVTRAGYLAPANLEVATSTDFLQPGRQPRHAEVINASVRSMRTLPLLDTWPELEAAVADELQELVSVPRLDLEAVTARIDEESRAVLDPEGAASEEPSEDGD